MKGDRYNKGKPRLGLIPPTAIKEIAKVFTFGAQKYDDNNWRKGLSFTSVLDSLERHINDFKEGKDIDKESGLHSLAHAGANVLFLLDYIKNNPECDDRWKRPTPRIALDIDEVLASFAEAYRKRHSDFPWPPQGYEFDRKIGQRLPALRDDKSFWMDMDTLINGEDLKFEPVAYITSRHVHVEWIEEWLDKHKFPIAPIEITGPSKVAACKKHNVEIFVDDYIKNFEELNRAGICTYLMDRPHNQRFDVGYKRLYNLNDLI